MTNVSFSSPIKVSGSNRTAINVSLGGVPAGQLWTYTAKGETHGWHAKTLDGAYRLFEDANKKVAGFDAMAWIATQLDG